MEEMSAMEIDLGMDGSIGIIPNLIKYVAPTLNVAYDILDVGDGLNIAKVPLNAYGMWQTSISINAQTSNCNIENDYIYTVIYVPK